MKSRSIQKNAEVGLDAVAKEKKLRKDFEVLKARIASQSAGSQILHQTEGIDIYATDSHSKEGRLKLRLWLAERIERINLSFGANVITTAPSIKGIESGEHKAVAQIVLRNGADRWIFFTDDKADFRMKREKRLPCVS
jgi:hypothetical protein